MKRPCRSIITSFPLRLRECPHDLGYVWPSLAAYLRSAPFHSLIDGLRFYAIRASVRPPFTLCGHLIAIARFRSVVYVQYVLSGISCMKVCSFPLCWVLAAVTRPGSTQALWTSIVQNERRRTACGGTAHQLFRMPRRYHFYVRLSTLLAAGRHGTAGSIRRSSGLTTDPQTFVVRSPAPEEVVRRRRAARPGCQTWTGRNVPRWIVSVVPRSFPPQLPGALHWGYGGVRGAKSMGSASSVGRRVLAGPSPRTPGA